MIDDSGQTTAISGGRKRALAFVKFGIIALIGVAFYLYLTRIATLRHVTPDTWSFEANGYVWSFAWTADSVLRWLLGLAAGGIFLFAGIRRSLPMPPATGVCKNAVLMAAITLALKTQDRLFFSWGMSILAAVICLAIFNFSRRRLNRRFDENRFKFVRRFARRPGVYLAVAAFIILAIAIYAIHGGYPVLVDEQSQIAQAKLILSGRVTLNVSPEFIRYAVLPSFIPASPTASQFTPGCILLQIPFVAAGIGVNWLNVICGALSVYFTVLFSRRLLQRGGAPSEIAGFIAGALLLGSPQFIVIQSSGMNHGLTMLMLIMAAWAFQECIRFARWNLLWVGIFGLAWAAIIRPYTAVPHGVVWGLALAGHGWSIMRQRRRGSRAPREISAANQAIKCIAAGGIPLLILAYYNHLTTGHALLFGYQKAQLHTVQFGFVSTGIETYSPAQAAHNTVSDLMSLSRNMFGWFMPSWILLFGWLIFTRFSRMEIIVVSLIALQFVFYRMYFWYELILGSRYLSELMPFFAILAAVGLARLIQTARSKWRPTLAAVVTILCLSAAIGGIAYWSGRLLYYVTKHQAAAIQMGKISPVSRPTVMVISYQYNDVAADYIFGDAPIWFVYQKDEQAARSTPEFRNCQWLPLFHDGR